MKTLFVDTQLFVACAFLTMEEGHSPEAIDGLSKYLENSSARLLLPEVVEIEFFSVVNDELIIIDKLKKQFLEELDTIFSNFPLVMNDKDKFKNLGKKIFEDRKKSSELAKTNARRLFDSKNTIKIPITEDILIRAYKRALSGQKPYEPEFSLPRRKPINLIDADCLIFESILSHFNKADRIEMIFCSNDIKHFAEYDKENKKHILHPELEKSFPGGSTIRYYDSLPKALNSEFKTKIKKEEDEKINTILGRSAAFGEVDSIKTLSQSIQSMRGILSGRLASLAKSQSIQYIGSTLNEGLASLAKSQSIQSIGSILNEELASLVKPTYSIEDAIRAAAEGGISSVMKSLDKGIAGAMKNVAEPIASLKIDIPLTGLTISSPEEKIYLKLKENNKKIQNKT